MTDKELEIEVVKDLNVCNRIIDNKTCKGLKSFYCKVCPLNSTCTGFDDSLKLAILWKRANINTLYKPFEDVDTSWIKKEVCLESKGNGSLYQIKQLRYDVMEWTITLYSYKNKEEYCYTLKQLFEQFSFKNGIPFGELKAKDKELIPDYCCTFDDFLIGDTKFKTKLENEIEKALIENLVRRV